MCGCTKGGKEGEWTPIMFDSRTLTGAEKNDPIGQLEQLAIVCGYRECCYTLYRRPIELQLVAINWRLGAKIAAFASNQREKNDTIF